MMLKLFVIKHNKDSYAYNIYAGNNRLMAKSANTYPSEIRARFAATRFAKGMSPLGYPINQQIRIVDYSKPTSRENK
jgi:uncharacterized protein YegP (UPF0339 family)